MSFSESRRRAGLPSTHYFLSISRGDTVRNIMVRPSVLWSIVALLPASLAFGGLGAADLALRVPPALAAAAAAAPAERVQQIRPRGLFAAPPLDPDALEEKISALAARQEKLERRGAILSALAAETASLPSPAGPRLDALDAIESLAPKPRRPDAATFFDDDGAARTYAPPKAAAPRGLDDQSLSDPAHPPRYAALAANRELDASARLDLLGRSLERLEGDEMTVLGGLDRKAARASERNAEILEKVGLDPEKLAAPKPRSMGGPFIPVDAAPEAGVFERAAAGLARDLSFAENLSALMPSVPLMKPLVGEAGVASPFGYRIDPFLGRPALHSGVDLLQPYGAEIRATASGHIVHAGPAGGYGDMVEIDHGHGFSTRYGHLSEILVAEGQDVAQGDLVGRLGSTGRSTGPHLHYEVRVDGEPVDPERFMRAGEEGE